MERLENKPKEVREKLGQEVYEKLQASPEGQILRDEFVSLMVYLKMKTPTEKISYLITKRDDIIEDWLDDEPFFSGVKVLHYVKDYIPKPVQQPVVENKINDLTLQKFIHSQLNNEQKDFIKAIAHARKITVDTIFKEIIVQWINNAIKDVDEKMKKDRINYIQDYASEIES